MLVILLLQLIFFLALLTEGHGSSSPIVIFLSNPSNVPIKLICTEYLGYGYQVRPADFDNFLYVAFNKPLFLKNTNGDKDSIEKIQFLF